MRVETDINPSTTKTWYAFSGCDIVIAINGEVKGEIKSIDVDSSTKEIIIDIIPFDVVYKKESLDFYKNLKDGNIIEAMANEYGQRAGLKYTGITYKSHKRKHSVDTMLTDQYIYSFKNEESIEWEEGTSFKEILQKNSK